MIGNDETFDALADEHRRQLLVGLVEQDPQYVPTLSGASRELTTANEALLRQYLSGTLEIDGAERALVRLHHVHLPKLVEYGFVEWERDAHVVTKGPRFDEVRPLLELIDDSREDSHAGDAVVPLLG